MAGNDPGMDQADTMAVFDQVQYPQDCRSLQNGDLLILL